MNRRPGSVWSLRHPDQYPNGLVRTTDDDKIEVSLTHPGFTERFIVSRADARLLAKRLNQCLDATVKR